MAPVPFNEARERAIAVAGPGRVEERGFDAAGLFLAEPVVAPRSLPGCDNSAMDGYAVRAEDTRGATRDRPARLRLLGAVYAGEATPVAVGPGQALRIFTGAPIPEGADAVVRQEATREAEGEVGVFVEAGPGDNVRRKGEELSEGMQVFARGQRVDAYVSALLASLGLTRVAVYAKVRVAVLTVGDELLEPGAPAAPHQLYDSNRHLISALASAANGEVVHVRRVKDDPAALSEGLEAALAAAEVVVTCGGASVGERDLVKAAVRALGGELVVDGVAIKPGKPVGLARVGQQVVAVLPGNPGAAAVGFDQLVRPLLLARQGVLEQRRMVRARLDSTHRKQAGLTYFLGARLERRGEEDWAVVRPQGSSQLLGNVAQDGWVVLPRGRAEFSSGDWVDLELSWGSRFVGLRDLAPAARPSPGAAPFAISFVGWSGSGKTRLIEALLPELRARGLKVAVMKHSSHPHPVQKEGSDTARFFAAGASQVAFVTPQAAQLTMQAGPDEVLQRLRGSGADLVLVEGWKGGPLRKLELRPEGAEPLPAEGGPVVAVLSESAAKEVRAVADQVIALARGEG